MSDSYSRAGDELGTSPAGTSQAGASQAPSIGEAHDESSAQQLKAHAQSLLDDAKDGAQATLNEKKDVAADQLHDVAGALRDAAARRDPEGDPLLGLTASAADGLDRLSGALRNKDVGVMMRDVESFARTQPVAFFGLALAAGFLAVRFMKASHS